MSRNGAGVYSLPPSYLAETGDTILADQHNSPLEDLQTDANTPRPIVAGGTGASSAVSARTNLSVMSVADIQSGYVPKVATKAALSALDTASFKAAVLTETTREKLWMWKSGDFSAEEAADTDNVNYIPADGVSTSLGCWVAATGDGVTVRTIAAGGTGADNAADARTNLGLAIGADVQAHSAVLDATTASFTTAQETKLSGIATGADVTSATNVNAAGAVMNTDTATTDMQFVGTGSDLSIDPAKLLKRGDALANVTAATKADAEALTPDTAPDFIRTAGYGSAGDGGGALYYSNGTTTGDLVITLSDGVTEAGYTVAKDGIDVRALGIVADGATKQTTALTTLFSALAAAGFRGTLAVPQNTKFDALTVYSSLPAGIVLDDSSWINFGQPPTYKNKFRIRVTGDTVDDDSQIVNISGHHPAHIDINLGTAGTEAANKRFISKLFGVGIDPFNDPMLGMIHQFLYDSATETWLFSERLNTPPEVALNVVLWQADTAYSAGDYVVTPTQGLVYKCSVAGTSGATEPTHLSGTATDGTVTWQFYQTALNLASTRFERRSNGDFFQFGPADHILSHKMTSGVRKHSLTIDGTTNKVTWRDDSRGRDIAAVTDGNGYYQDCPGSFNFRAATGATPSVIGRALYITQPAATDVTGFTLPTSQTQGHIRCLFGDGNSTLKAASINLKGGVDVTPSAGDYMEFIRYTSLSSSWREISRSF